MKRMLVAYVKQPRNGQVMRDCEITA